MRGLDVVAGFKASIHGRRIFDGALHAKPGLLGKTLAFEIRDMGRTRPDQQA
jgi:hypothetical protein